MINVIPVTPTIFLAEVLANEFDGQIRFVRVKRDAERPVPLRDTT